MNINDIPDEALHCVATFLSKAEIALLVTGISEGVEDCPAIRAKLPSPDELDFADVDKDVASRLNGDGLRIILLSIDAANNLKQLKLTNCLAVTGSGLKPLRGSTVLELLDVSLVGMGEYPDIVCGGKISRDAVKPIVKSIFNTGDRMALKYVHFPGGWEAADASLKRGLSNFYVKRQTQCSHSWCSNVIDSSRAWGECCYLCLEQTVSCNEDDCEQHRLHQDHDDDPDHSYFDCFRCERHICLRCGEMTRCQHCSLPFCLTCICLTCDGCNETFCEHCASDDAVQAFYCSYCCKTSCFRCRGNARERGEYCVKCKPRKRQRIEE